MTKILGPFDFESNLSSNTITFEVVNGSLQVTHEGGDRSWGEGLSPEDTAKLVGLLLVSAFGGGS